VKYYKLFLWIFFFAILINRSGDVQCADKTIYPSIQIIPAVEIPEEFKNRLSQNLFNPRNSEDYAKESFLELISVDRDILFNSSNELIENENKNLDEESFNSEFSVKKENELIKNIEKEYLALSQELSSMIKNTLANESYEIVEQGGELLLTIKVIKALCYTTSDEPRIIKASVVGEMNNRKIIDLEYDASMNMNKSISTIDSLPNIKSAAVYFTNKIIKEINNMVVRNKRS